ncbi:MAG: beta-lactamase family protein [Solirubrobacterales bacterium]|nr:beta-lactamase family protein [Solirubrobacterales bacterium]
MKLKGASRGLVAAAILTGVIALAGITGGPAGAAPDGNAAASGSTSAKRLNDLLGRVVAQKNGPPGVAVLINRNGKSRLFRRGVANVGTGVPITRRQHFRIASVSKAFNGGIVLMLASQGKLRLRDRLGKWVPNLLPKARRATIGQVLHHTAGLPDYIKDKPFVKLLIANPHRYMSPRKMVGFVAHKRLRFKPGSRYEYSDTDNIVAGIIARKAAGKSYRRLLRQLGRRAGGLPGTSLPNGLAMPKPLMPGYVVEPGNPPLNQTFAMNPALAWASGGMISTLPDLGRYFRAYVGGRLFGPWIVRAQRQWVKGGGGPPGPGRNSAGLSLYRYRTKCGTVYGHTGNYPGYRLFVAASASGKRSLVWVTNVQTTAEFPVPGSKKISAVMDQSQLAAVCHMLS